MVVWAKTADSYVLPSIKLSVTGAGWLSGAAVGSWMVDRELVASTIPGNIRQRTGLSIGAASVTVRPAVRATPWSKTPATRVTDGLPATLYAEASDGTTKTLGAWVTDETDGSLSAEDVTVDLLEASFVGREMPQTLPPANWNRPFFPNRPVDPVWPVSRMLEKVGFPSVPIGREDAMLRVPMDGAIQASGDREWTAGGQIVGGWSLMPDGTLGGSSGSAILSVATGPPFAPGTMTWHIALNVVGTVYLVDDAQGWMVRVVNDQSTGTYNVAASNNAGVSWGTTRTFAGRQSADWPDRVQIELSRTLTSAGMSMSWTSTSARARSSAVSSWSSLSTHSSTLPLATPDSRIWVAGGYAVPGVPGIPGSPPAGRFSAFIMDIAQPSSDDLWAPRRAFLKPLGGDLGMPMVPPGLDAWGVIQDCASANLGGVVIDLDGMARVLTRDDLAGTGAAGAAVDVGSEWEDLAWTLDPEDTADRVEVSFTPPTITEADFGSSTLAPEVWSADGVIPLNAGETITIPVTFDSKAAIGVFSTFIVPVGTPSALWSQNSTICSYDNPDGAGVPLDASLVTASARQTSSTTAEITVANRTGAMAYLVDGNGDPCLILRARTVATYATRQIVERGAAADVAQRPLQVDLTPWVQSQAHASTIADYLWDRVSGGGLWKASSVRCRLDWSLDIGQVRSLAHSRSGLDAKALITKVHFDGSEVQIAQSLDLVLIPWTYSDFAATWPTQTYAQFATAQGTRTYADHEADPLWTGA
jgi:hypothetical protein